MAMYFILSMALSFILLTMFTATKLDKVEIEDVKLNYGVGDKLQVSGKIDH